jgi:hypothetical protein
LPLAELNLAEVLHPRPVLRKQARPVLPARVDLHTPIPTPPGADATFESNGSHRLSCLIHNPWIVGIEVDAEPEHPTRALDDVSVSQVEPHEVRIGLGVQEDGFATHWAEMRLP